jgi:hypothetical protein
MSVGSKSRGKVANSDIVLCLYAKYMVSYERIILSYLMVLFTQLTTQHAFPWSVVSLHGAEEGTTPLINGKWDENAHGRK